MYFVCFTFLLALAINPSLSDEYHPSGKHKAAPRAAAQEGESKTLIHFSKHSTTYIKPKPVSICQFYFFTDTEYWLKKAEDEIDATLKSAKSLNFNKAKNIIMFIGDGMSLPTLTAARIYKAQYEGRQEGKVVNGEESLLTFEEFPNVGLSKVKNYYI